MSTASRAVTTLHRYRWLVYELVLRDLRLRYRGSVLGFAWTLLNPLLFLAVYTLVFSVYLKVSIPHFALFLLCGIIPWTWLSTAVSLGTTAILDGRMYVGKTLFPTEVLVVVPVISAAVNFLLSLPVLLIFALILHVHLGAALLALPLVVAIEFLVVQGLVLLAATVNVFFRDLQQLTVHGLTIWFYMTPIFYTRSMVPSRFDVFVAANPFAPIALAFQDIFYRGALPNAMSLLFPLLFGVFLIGFAHGIFARYRESFSQYL